MGNFLEKIPVDELVKKNLGVVCSQKAHVCT
jgi:hypothetical protein